ncbi:hypothetical protein QE152_g9185 [Popillia japonica]|uniref:Uncharacterized protein n=1 Tax=Popillia japonica TaxID=7064 RepID=A0AAW1LVJ6_POPJA
MDDERLVWKRHVDQVIGIGSFYDNLSEPCKSKPDLVQTEVHDDNDSIDSHGGISDVTVSTPEMFLNVVSDGCVCVHHADESVSYSTLRVATPTVCCDRPPGHYFHLGCR